SRLCARHRRPSAFPLLLVLLVRLARSLDGTGRRQAGFIRGMGIGTVTGHRGHPDGILERGHSRIGRHGLAEARLSQESHAYAEPNTVRPIYPTGLLTRSSL